MTRVRWPYLWALIVAAGLLAAGSPYVWPPETDHLPDEKIMDKSAPVKGPADARVTIVNFSDFQCDDSQRLALALEKWMEKYPDDIRLVWMDRPLIKDKGDGLPFFPFSMTAHRAGAEAHRQGKFWPFYVYVYENQGKIFPLRPDTREGIEAGEKEVKEKLIIAAKESGLSAEAMKKALDSGEHEDTVMKRREMALALDITGTPTVFVNGYNAGSDFARIKWSVEKALSKRLP